MANYFLKTALAFLAIAHMMPQNFAYGWARPAERYGHQFKLWSLS